MSSRAWKPHGPLADDPLLPQPHRPGCRPSSLGFACLVPVFTSPLCAFIHGANVYGERAYDRVGHRPGHRGHGAQAARPPFRWGKGSQRSQRHDGNMGGAAGGGGEGPSQPGRNVGKGVLVRGNSQCEVLRQVWSGVREGAVGSGRPQRQLWLLTAHSEGSEGPG